eukprot:CAMPEP_0202338988 /NCGR_PEP_ID=MMETSP1126-20121109/1041_1 /ASSEMBLY_ACC=CAM_ASM_000457 /TAXON_ID=3047 /ORGANISM="Dunaliella tertiolecta, Strain CCMP1320" /LENGTH=448 /DNA_ID=CAMNT_0048929471 /DNA_START=12 /DNA_END=1358 /DNA_ORIENTATION=-
MPRTAQPRQRIVYCDCLDCRDLLEALAVASSVARQVPHPPKGLLIYASGFLSAQEAGKQTSADLENLPLPHLDRAAHDGCLGLLAVRSSTAAEPSTRGIMELSQVLGVHDEFVQGHGSKPGASQAMPNLSERFKGMSAIFTSTSPAATELATSVGCTPTTNPSLTLGASSSSSPSYSKTQASTQTGLPDPVQYADALTSELGPEQGGSGPDLLIVHLDAQDLSTQGECSQHAPDDPPHSSVPLGEPLGTDGGALGLQWVDKLVGRLLAQKAVRERVLLSVVVSAQGMAVPGGSGLAGAAGSSRSPMRLTQHQQQAQQLQQGGMQVGGAAIDPLARVVTPLSSYPSGGNTDGKLPQGLDVLETSATGGAVSLVNRPVQSFQFSGLSRIEIAHGAPAVVVRHLPGVIRRDRAERMKLSEAHQRGGQGTILADRLMYEIMYKLGRAPKYGA